MFTRVGFDSLDAGQIGFRLPQLTVGTGGFTVERGELRFNLRNTVFQRRSLVEKPQELLPRGFLCTFALARAPLKNVPTRSS